VAIGLFAFLNEYYSIIQFYSEILKKQEKWED